jgi:hypothetical protein
MLRTFERLFRKVPDRELERRIGQKAKARTIIAPNRESTHSRSIALGLRPDIGVEEILDSAVMSSNENTGTAITVVLEGAEAEPFDIFMAG